MAKKSAGTLHIDFGKEEEGGGGNRIHWPEGDYHVQILKASTGRSSEKDTPYLEVHFKVLDGKKKGKTFAEQLYITPKSLTRIRLLLEAIGVKVPKSAVNIPLKKLRGKTLWVELGDEEREGYDTRSRVTFRGFESEEEHDEEDDEDEDIDDDEDEDEEDEDEEDEDDDEEDDEDDEDEDEEEEEEPPKKKARKRKAKPKPAAKKKGKKGKKKSSDDDLEELDLDDL